MLIFARFVHWLLSTWIGEAIMDEFCALWWVPWIIQLLDALARYTIALVAGEDGGDID